MTLIWINNLYTTFYANGILGLILDWIKNGLEPHPDYMAKTLVKNNKLLSS